MPPATNHRHPRPLSFPACWATATQIGDPTSPLFPPFSRINSRLWHGTSDTPSLSCSLPRLSPATALLYCLCLPLCSPPGSVCCTCCRTARRYCERAVESRPDLPPRRHPLPLNKFPLLHGRWRGYGGQRRMVHPRIGWTLPEWLIVATAGIALPASRGN